MNCSIYRAVFGAALLLPMSQHAVAQGNATAVTSDSKTDSEELAAVSTPGSVMPMMSVAVERAGRTATDPSPVGAYTRLILEYVPETKANDAQRNYDKIGRDWFRRFFASKDITRLLTVKASLRRPQVTATATAISAGYQSGKKVGESWSSEVTGQRILTPYFRIDSGSGLNLELELAVSSAYNSSFGSGVIDLVRRATSLVSPASSLITSLNKDRFTQASQFVDETLSSSLSESIVERSSNDFPMKIYAGKPLATVALKLPLGNEITPGEHNPPHEGSHPVGRWRIRADAPIVSIFSTRSIDHDAKTDDAKTDVTCATGPFFEGCQALKGRVTANGILNFPVDTGVTIAQALAGDSAVAAARDKVASTKEENSSGEVKADDKPGTTRTTEKVNADAKALCALVTDRLEILGFNRLDTAAILWAYTRQTFGSEDATIWMQKEAACPPLRLAYGIGLDTKDAF